MRHGYNILKTANKRSAALQARTNNNEKALKPVVIVNEKDIALNLPVSTQFNSLKTTAAPTTNTTPLKLNNHTPPSMSADRDHSDQRKLFQ